MTKDKLLLKPLLGVKVMAKQRGRLVPILASVGIGAAAYYSMKRKGVGSVASQMVPFAAGMGNQGNQGQQNQNNSQF